ncbi:MAG: WbqC family protein [Cyclobacteriaceae bacterium]|nr:WbqC family protein [Cyclobacteriaceae bacterium]
MKIAIMQPYFFPYIGYFQLINTVDKFIIYDDVNYIKGGWINRNRILVNGQPNYINIEMNGASPNKKIREIEINTNPIWKTKLLKKIEQNYSKAPYFDDVNITIKEILFFDSKKLSDVIVNSIIKILDLLEVNTKIERTSAHYGNNALRGENRVIDICVKENATTYINSIGGIELYNKERFKNAGVELLFLKSNELKYSQQLKNNIFIPKLSIIDTLYYCGKNNTAQMLEEYKLIPGN